VTTEGYTISDLTAMRELNHRNGNRWALEIDDMIEQESVSNLSHLRQLGYDDDVAERAALTWDAQRWPGNRYREVFADPEPLPTERDWLLGCGYSESTVDAHLAKVAERRRRDKQLAAERAALERTWRYRASKAWRTAKDRIALAWSVLRGQHSCGED
jgi:hypothetical protein